MQLFSSWVDLLLYVIIIWYYFLSEIFDRKLTIDEGEVNTFFHTNLRDFIINSLKELQSKSNKTKDENSSELNEDS